MGGIARTFALALALLVKTARPDAQPTSRDGCIGSEAKPTVCPVREVRIVVIADLSDVVRFKDQSVPHPVQLHHDLGHLLSDHPVDLCPDLLLEADDQPMDWSRILLIECLEALS